MVYTTGLKVLVKCSQTGERILADISDLSNEDGDKLADDEVCPKSKVIVDYKGIPYPAEVIRVESE